jgi:hypothetical protein
MLKLEKMITKNRILKRPNRSYPRHTKKGAYRKYK